VRWLPRKPFSPSHHLASRHFERLNQCDAATNDTAAVQAAIDAAFGPASAPHAIANQGLNKPLWFRHGGYCSVLPWLKLSLTRISKLLYL
jgi:hypothetical protein